MTSFASGSQHKSMRDALQAFPPGNIYLIAPKDYVARGFSYYGQSSVFALGWNKDGRCLTARVRGTRVYAVNMLLKNGALFFSCTCPAWSEETNCKHVVCAILTVMNLLNPSLFIVPGRKQPYRKKLLGELLEGVPTAKPLEAGEPEGHFLLIDVRQKVPELSVECGGGDAWRPVPRELQIFSLPSSASWHRTQKLHALAGYLEKYENAYPIIIRQEGKDTPVAYDAESTYSAVTRLDAAGDSIEVKKLCFKNGVLLDTCRFFGRLAFDPAANTLGILNDEAGWKTWRLIEQALEFDDLDDEGFEAVIPLPADFFH